MNPRNVFASTGMFPIRRYATRARRGWNAKLRSVHGGQNIMVSVDKKHANQGNSIDRGVSVSLDDS